MFRLLKPMILRGDFQTLIQKLDEMIEEARSGGAEPAAMADLLADMATAQLALGDLNASTLHIAEILTLDKADAACRAHALLTVLKTCRGETSEAEQHLDLALELARRSNRGELMLDVALAGMEWCLATDRLEEAHDFMAAARPSEKHDRTMLLLRGAQCQMREEKFDEAITNAQEAIKLSQWDSYLEQEWEGCALLAQIFRKLGNKPDYRYNIDRACALIFEISDRLSPELQKPYLEFFRRAEVLRQGQELMFPEDKKSPERIYKQMLEATEDMNRQQDLRKLLDASVDLAIESCEGLRGYILVSDANGSRYHAARHVTRRPLAEEEIHFSRAVADVVTRSGQALLSANILKDSRLAGIEQTAKMGPCSVICVPLRTRHRKVGVLYVDSSSATHTYTEEDLLIVETFASHAALAIDNALQFAASVRDPLTGLYHSAYLWRVLERELRRAKRHQKVLALALVDLDGFRQINAQFGPGGGDRVLKHAAALLKDRFPAATVARHAGDTFAAVWIGVSENELRSTFEKTLEAFRVTPAPVDGATVSVTVSIGAAVFPRDGAEARDLFLAAEAALARAKAGGKNRLEMAR